MGDGFTFPRAKTQRRKENHYDHFFKTLASWRLGARMSDWCQTLICDYCLPN